MRRQISKTSEKCVKAQIDTWEWNGDLHMLTDLLRDLWITCDTFKNSDEMVKYLKNYRYKEKESEWFHIRIIGSIFDG